MAEAKFTDRIRFLADQVGSGRLVGSVTVDQIYAAYQHERLDLRHPGGGQAKYLEEPLYARQGQYMERLARDAITKDGSSLESAMADNMEDLSRQVQEKAPVLWGDLRNSGHPQVTSKGRTVYDRPPEARRLTEAELRVKARWVPPGYYGR